MYANKVKFPALRGKKSYAFCFAVMAVFFLTIGVGFAPLTSPVPNGESSCYFELQGPLSDAGEVAVSVLPAWQTAYPAGEVTVEVHPSLGTMNVYLSGSGCVPGEPGEEIALIEVVEPGVGTVGTYLLKRDGGGVLVILADV